jgi:hypothetical protein
VASSKQVPHFSPIRSDRTATNAIHKIDSWLLRNALVIAEGDDYLTVLLLAINPRRVSHVDRDTLNLVVFGDVNGRMICQS